jgi:spore coat protein U-like protein
MKHLTLALLAAVGFATAQANTIPVSYTIQGSCSVSSTPTVTFTPSASIPSNVSLSNSFSVTCSNGQAYSVTLDNGLNHNGTTRRMQDGASGNFITYEVFRNPGEASGNLPVNNTRNWTNTGNGSAQSNSFIVQVPAQSVPGVGTYTDTLTVVVTL